MSRCKACNQLLADYEGDLCGQCYNLDSPTEIDQQDYEEVNIDDESDYQTSKSNNQSVPQMQV